MAKKTENIQVYFIQGLIESMVEKVGYEEALKMCATHDETQVVHWAASNLYHEKRKLQEGSAERELEAPLVEYLQKKFGGWLSAKVLEDNGKFVRVEMNFGDEEIIAVVNRRKGEHGNYRVVGTY